MNVRVATETTVMEHNRFDDRTFVRVQQWAYLDEELQCKVTFSRKIREGHSADAAVQALELPLHDGMSVRELLNAVWSMGMDVGYEYSNIYELTIPNADVPTIGESSVSFEGGPSAA